MNWLERARREIGGMSAPPTANTAEANPTAVMALLARAVATEPLPSIGSNGSALPRLIQGLEALRDAFEERAAIMEYDGGMTRDEAERAAWALVTKHRLH